MSSVLPVGSGAVNYSTEEQVIGTWIDGKPIYQKTWDGLSISLTTGTWNTVISNLLNIENYIGCKCYFGSVGDRSELGFRGAQIINGTTFRVDPTEARTLSCFTLQYTKTTD